MFRAVPLSMLLGLVACNCLAQERTIFTPFPPHVNQFRKIALRCAMNNLYVCADPHGGPMLANRERHNLWETFELERDTLGKYSLKSYVNGLWVNFNGTLMASSAQRGDDELFDVEIYADGKIAMRSSATGLYVATEGGDASLNANRAVSGPWGKFEVVYVLAQEGEAPLPSGFTRKFVPGGQWVTLEEGFNSSASALFKNPKGAQVHAAYVITPDGDISTLDGEHPVVIDMGGLFWKLDIKVPFATIVYYGYPYYRPGYTNSKNGSAIKIGLP